GTTPDDAGRASEAGWRVPGLYRKAGAVESYRQVEDGAEEQSIGRDPQALGARPRRVGDGAAGMMAPEPTYPSLSTREIQTLPDDARSPGSRALAPRRAVRADR